MANPIPTLSLDLNDDWRHFQGQTTKNAARLIGVINEILARDSLSGAFFESGTYRGLSAMIFLGLGTVSGAVLVDQTNYLESDKIAKYTHKPFKLHIGRSEDFDFSSLDFGVPLVWAHLDASHYFSNVTHEITCVSEIMDRKGMIVLDDWNDVYGQIKAAYYFLRYQGCEWELLVTGFNKAILVNKRIYDIYSKRLIELFSADIFINGELWPVQLCRTDISEWCRSFTVRPRGEDEDHFYGRKIWGDRFYQVA